MSNETKPLTGEENMIKYAFGEWNKTYESIGPTADKWNAFVEGFKYHAQQTAALREELDKAKQSAHSEKLLREQAERIYNAEHAELEAVKKERDEHKNRYVDLVSFINALAPNMAEQFARHDYRSMWEIWEMLRGRLSSGETKELNAVKLLEKAMQERDEAVRLLKERILHDIEMDFLNKETGEMYHAEIPYHLLPIWRAEIISFLSRLSSGETKPPEIPDSSANKTFYCAAWEKEGYRCESGQCAKCWRAECANVVTQQPPGEWISVKDSLPEPYADVYGGSYGDNGKFRSIICWHTGEFWDRLMISDDLKITHWAYVPDRPAPPEPQKP